MENFIFFAQWTFLDVFCLAQLFKGKCYLNYQTSKTFIYYQRYASKHVLGYNLLSSTRKTPDVFHNRNIELTILFGT